MTGPIEHLRKHDPRLSKLINRIGPIVINSLNDKEDPFVFLVGEIIGQMLSSKVRNVIFGRLINLCGNQIKPTTLEGISVEELRAIGLSYPKITYIKNLATIFIRGDLDVEGLSYLPDNEAIELLTSIKGIGQWTAKMYLLFYLHREDVLPYEDVAFLQAYKWLYGTNDTSPKSIEKQCFVWKPYSSIAARYLYKALDTGLTKIPIQEFLNDF